MIRECIYCEPRHVLGEVPPFENKGVTSGICPAAEAYENARMDAWIAARAAREAEARWAHLRQQLAEFMTRPVLAVLSFFGRHVVETSQLGDINTTTPEELERIVREFLNERGPRREESYLVTHPDVLREDLARVKAVIAEACIFRLSGKNVPWSLAKAVDVLQGQTPMGKKI